MDEEEEEETEELKPIAVETKVSDTGGCAKALGVTVPAAAVNKEFDAVVGELAGSLRLPGFRPGKVPRQLIEKRFAEAIRDRVTTDIVKRAVSTALSKERLDVVGEPKLDVKNLPKVQRGQPFSFSLDLEVRPAFELSNYKGLVVEQEEVELLPEEVEEGILRLRERFSEFVDLPPEHPIGNRNLVKGTLRFTVEGKEVHQAEEQLFVMDGLVLGAHAQLKEEFLQGAKVGEKRSTAATLDEGFPVAEYRGKNATIDLEIASIKQQTLLPAGDALAQKVGLKTLEELQARVRSELLEKLSDEVRSRTEHELLERIVSATPFELPKRLQDTLSHANKERSLEQLKEMGIDVASLGEHRAMFESKAKDQAAAEIRRWFVMDAICAKEGITVSDEDIDQEIVRLARARNMRASDLYDKLRDTDQLERLEAQLKTQKLLEFLVQEAEIRVVPRKPRPKPQGREQGLGAQAGPPAGEAGSAVAETPVGEKPATAEGQPATAQAAPPTGEAKSPVPETSAGEKPATGEGPPATAGATPPPAPSGSAYGKMPSCPTATGAQPPAPSDSQAG